MVDPDSPDKITPSRDDVQGGNDAGEDAGSMQGDAQHDAGAGKLKSGVDASRAASLRWEKERARQAAKDRADAGAPSAPDDHVLRWTGSVRVGQIVAALEQKARKGDSHAARELRSWLSEYPPQDDDIDLADMPRVMRQRLLKRLVAELEEEDAANGDNA